LCQRYYFKQTNGSFGSSYSISTTGARALITFPVTMRTSPTALEQTGTATDYSTSFAGTSRACSAVPAFASATEQGSSTTFTVASGLTAGQGGNSFAAVSTAYLAWSAEL